ncbi:MAG: type III pantothenate kinase [Candidatus Competibacteraceae bacterium]|nr:type III pantothenate kinase [Candidatus Competibacteraceae bacterium]
MILLVDAGNTRVKWLLWEGERLLTRGGLAHRGIPRRELAPRLWGGLQAPARVLIANVAGPELGTALAAWMALTWSLTPRFVASEARGYGISNAYAHPERLGVDRWVAMIGARSLSQGPSSITDCGTAVTVDGLSQQGEHLGGVIIPGPKLMRQALYLDTSQIPPEEGEVVLFGRNTRDGVWSGTAHAVAAAVDRISGRMADALGFDTRHFLTGGDAEVLLPYLEGSYRLEPDLIFQGLLVMAGEA